MHNCEDMFLLCLWKGKKVNCSEIFHIRKTDNGFCCSFNSLETSELYRNATILNQTLTKNDMENFYDDYYSNDEDRMDYFWSSSESFYGCGGIITESNGSVSSPENVELLQCEWVIRSEPWNQIHLHFQRFGIKNHVDYKCLDYVAIYDGGSPKFPLLGRYCGNIIPPDQFSTGNQLLIRYRSEHSSTHNGFIVNYQMFPNGSETVNNIDATESISESKENLIIFSNI